MYVIQNGYSITLTAIINLHVFQHFFCIVLFYLLFFTTKANIYTHVMVLCSKVK